MNIEIEWLSDDFDCDTCGGSWAEGAIVRFDGEVVIDMTPVAHCYGGDSYSQDMVYTAILEKLGHVIVFKGE